jgi:hypothetical protein
VVDDRTEVDHSGRYRCDVREDDRRPVYRYHRRDRCPVGRDLPSGGGVPVTYKVTEHLWWNASRTKLVPGNTDDAAFLAFAKGDVIADELAIKAGLLPPVPVRSPQLIAEEKLRAASPANKIGGRGAANKGAKAPSPDEETL